MRISEYMAKQPRFNHCSKCYGKVQVGPNVEACVCWKCVAYLSWEKSEALCECGKTRSCVKDKCESCIRRDVRKARRKP